MKAALALSATLLLTGCTLDLDAAHWAKPQTLPQQVTADEYVCAHRAFLIGPGPDLGLGGLLDVLRLSLQESRQERTFDGCMTSQGYAKVE
jgi:hypothetical protein